MVWILTAETLNVQNVIVYITSDRLAFIQMSIYLDQNMEIIFIADKTPKQLCIC